MSSEGGSLPHDPRGCLISLYRQKTPFIKSNPTVLGNSRPPLRQSEPGLPKHPKHRLTEAGKKKSYRSLKSPHRPGGNLFGLGSTQPKDRTASRRVGKSPADREHLRLQPGTGSLGSTIEGISPTISGRSFGSGPRLGSKFCLPGQASLRLA